MKHTIIVQLMLLTFCFTAISQTNNKNEFGKQESPHTETSQKSDLFISESNEVKLFKNNKSSEIDKFQFYVSYGPCYIGFIRDKSDVFYTSNPRTIMETGFDFRLRYNRFIGVSFARQERNKVIKSNLLMWGDDSGMLFENYRHKDEVNYFNINFRTEYKSGLHLTYGLAFFLIYEHFFNYRLFDEHIRVFMLSSNEQRADHFALTFSLDYYIPIRQHFEIGVRSKAYLTLYGLEPISLSPIMKFSF